ncbi:MAG TPA: ribbon-helix-helix domain-containing protein [Amycolatopsis sp.]|nr:ribbon-helix-helix domain-containing protein [Amycolatopsis sp.]
MSKQIAVRLPEDLVEFIDDAVAAGDASNRADLVLRALEHERRRLIAERDIEILSRAGTPDGLHGLAEHAARTPMDDLD